MGLFHWRRWLSRQLDRARGARPPRPRRAPRRPQLEALEDRLAPATLTWTGALGTINTWGAAIQSPTGSGIATNWTSSDGRFVAIPQAGDDLVFPAGAAQQSNTNDLKGLSVNSVTFQASGYFVNGNAVTVTASIADQAAGGSNGLAVPLVLPNTTSVGVTQANETLLVETQISGAGGITKTGPGGLFEFGPANTYAGATQVNAGLLFLAKTGAVPGALTVGTGTGTPTQVLLNADAATAPTTALIVNSDGLFAVGEDGSDAALASFVGDSSSDTIGSLTLNGGTVSIAGSQFQGDIPASVLTLGGDVMALASATTATVQGGGMLSLGGANRAFTVADGSADPDLLVSATIADGAPVTAPVAPGANSAGTLTLTSPGAGAGFTLSTFATGFSERGDGLGPLSVVFPKSGGVLADEDVTGNVYRFPTDTDGQNVASAPVTASYGFNRLAGITRLGDTLYATTANGNTVIQLNDNGTLNHGIADITNADGIAGDPLTGHLFVSAFAGAIFDVDPMAETATVFANVAADGLAFDPTTNTLYAAAQGDPNSNSATNGHVLGFNAATRAQVFDSGFVPGNPDGTAVGTGSLAGNLFVNTNGGTLIEINLVTQAQTVIATGGSRGDFVSVDPTNDTLLVTQSDRLLRLIPPSGGGFAGGSPAGLAKAGAGRMVLSASNTYSGGTDVKAGELNVQSDTALGSGSATVETGAALELQAPAADSTLDLHNALTLNGGGVGGAGALDNVLGNNSVEGDITLASDSAIGVDAGNPSLEDRVAGPGGLTKVGPGTLMVADPDSGAAANSYGGATLVAQGLLDLEKAWAVPGALTVGTGSAITTAQALLGVDAATSPTTAVTVNSDGLLAVGEDGSDAALTTFAGSSSNDTIASLALNGGTVSIAGPQPGLGFPAPASVLTLGGDLTANAATVTATIQGGGTLSLGGADRTFTVAGGGADPALVVSAAVADGVATSAVPPGGTSSGPLTLTSAATAAGFTFSTFATGFPSDSTVGPIGIAFPGDGGVLVTDYPGNLRRFPSDTNDQNAGSFGIQSYGDHNATGLALVGGQLYMAQQNNGQLVQIDPSGRVLQVVATGLGNALGVVANPANGHLFVSGIDPTNAIFDVDPIAHTATVFVNAADPDGLSISPDGRVLYAAVRGAGGGGHIIGYDTITKAQVFDSGPVNGVDGTALGAGSLAGFVFGNTTDGRVVQVSLATNAAGGHDMTVLAQGGSRGDFLAVDPQNGTLLLTQTDRVARLIPPPGGGFLGGSPAGLTKAGTGRMVLGATNSYTGTTQVNDGTLTLAAPSAVIGPLVVGDAAALAQIVVNNGTAPTVPVTVNATGELDVGGPGISVSDTIGTLTLNGGTVNIAGPQLNGQIEPSLLELGGDVTTNDAAVTATIAGTGFLSLGGSTRTFTVAASSATPAPYPDLLVSAVVISGPNGSQLAKAGAGRMVLSGDNGYNGADVLAGELNLQNDNALGAGDDINANATVEAGAALEIQAPGTTPLTIRNGITLNGSGVGGIGALRNVAGDNFLDSNFFVLASDSSIGVDAGSLDFENQVGGPGGLTKVGPGSLTLDNPTFTTAANTYGGDTNVNQGLLVLAKAGAVPGALVVGTGTGTSAQVLLSADAATSATTTVTVNSDGLFAVGEDGSDPSPAGAFEGLSSNDTIASLTLNGGTVSIAGIQFEGSVPASVLTLGGDVTAKASAVPASIQGAGTLSLGGATRTFTVANGSADPDLSVSVAIADGGASAGLTKAGAGRMSLAHANSYTGTTEADAGTLSLDAADAVVGPLLVGDAPALVQINAAGATGASVPVTVNNTGELDVNADDTIGPLTLNGGTVNVTGVSVLTLGGDVTANASTATAVIEGPGLVSLGDLVRTFTVDDGGADPGLVVSAAVADGPSGSELVKAGAGRMVLSGANTYQGNTDIAAGELNVQSDTALGAGDATVEAGAALEIQGPGAPPINITNALTLNGSGVDGAGALDNVSGSNAVEGDVTLASASAIGVDAGGLVLQDQVTGPGGLRKIGVGNLTLANPVGLAVANDYGGETDVDAGLLVLAKAGAVPGLLVVGTGTGTPAQVLLAADAATAPTTAVTVNSDGLFAVGEDGSDPLLVRFRGASSNDTIASLALNGGTVSIAGPVQQFLPPAAILPPGPPSQVPASVLNLGGDVTANPSAVTATIRGGGTLSLGGADRTFTVAGGGADPGLVVSATVADGVPVTSPVLPGGSSAGGLTLTPAGTTAGFTLSTFATGFPERSDGVGPLAVVFPASGGVLVSDTPGNVRLFPADADGQNAASFPPMAGASYGTSHAEGMARLGDALYLNLGELNQVAQINDDGTINHIVTSIANADGMTADPLTGHLFVSGFDGAIFDVDPVAGTATVFANVHADGLAFDPATNTLYAAGYDDPVFDGHIVGFNATSRAMVFDSGFIPGRPDGTAVGAGALAGNLFVNTNAGTLVEISLATHVQTLLASGGSRGDFVSVDPTNGTLLVTQSDRLLRLIPAAGGGFVGGSPAGLTKAGTGQLVLGATNSYSGTTQVDAGTLSLAAPSAVVGPLVVGDAPALAQITVDNATAPSVPVTVNATGELDVNADDPIGPLTLNGGTVNIAAASALTLGGHVTANAGATTATIQGAGTLSLGGAVRTFTVAGGAADPDLTVSATVGDGAGSSELVKAGAGRMVVLSENAYSGGTDVTTGALNVQDSGALGAGAATVEAGAALEVQAPGAGSLVLTNSLTLNGSGIGGTGALRNISGAGNQIAAASITLASDSAVGVDAGSLDLNADGPVSGLGGLTKVGAGTLILEGGNSYGGPTQVNAGLLVLHGAEAVPGPLTVGTGTGTPAQVLLAADAATDLATAVTVNSDGLLAVGEDGSDPALADFAGSRSSDTISALTLNGGTVTIAGRQQSGKVPASVLTLAGDVTATSGALQGGGRLSLGGATRTFTVAAVLTVGVTVEDGGASAGLTKAGSGNLVLRATNSYTGTTQVDAGTLTLAAPSAVIGPLVVGDAPALAQVVVANGTAPSVPVTVNATGEFDVNADDTIGSLTLNGGTVIIAGPQRFVNQDAGQLVLGPPSVLTLGGDVNTTAAAGTATIQGGGMLSLGGADRTFTVADGTADPDLAISAVIIDGGASAGLIKAGPGRMELDATNSYTGTTQVGAGTLTLAAPSSVSGPLVVGGTAGTNPAVAQITEANATAPGMAVTVNATGELDVNAADAIGALTLNGGTVNIAATSTLTLAGDVTAPTSTSHIGGGGNLSLGNAPRALNVAAGAEVDVNTPVDGSAAATLTKSGAGTLALQTDNVYHGLTVVADGVLNVESTLALGDTAAGTTVQAGATLAVVSGPHVNGVANIPEPLTLNGPGFQGGAALVSTFVGNLFFPNSWSGPILLNTDSAVEVDDPLTITGLISGPGGLIVRGQLPLTLAAAGNNSYRGATVVDGGDLQLRQSGSALPGDLVIGTGDGKSSVCDVLADEQIPDGARVTIDAGGVLGLNGQRETIGSLAGAGEVILNNSRSGPPGNGNPSLSRVGTLITGTDNTSTTYAGTISGPGGSLVKVGGGVFVLQGNNTYSGSTTINGGTLRVDGSQPSSAVIVNAGGTLGGSGTVGPTAVNPGGTVSPGDSPGVLTVQGGITFSPGSVLIAEINGPAAGTGYDQLKVSGRVVLNGATLRLALGFSPSPGQDFVVIVNNGSGPVSGTFAGLPEDAVLEHGTTFLDLSYAGGRGGDVDLRGLSRGDLFVRALFSDFDSPSSRTTRASFEQQVDGGAARLSVAQGFFVSPDRRLGEVLQFYQAFGQPLDGRQGVYMAELLRGVPAGQVLIEFLTSPAFRRLHRSNRAFVKALFTGLLGHPPGKHDLLGRHPFTYYLGQLTGGAVSRAGLVKQLLSTDEVYRAAVLQNYTTFLGLRPTAAQLQALTGQLESGQLMPDTLSETIITQEGYIDFFVTRAGANQAPGVVLVNV